MATYDQDELLKAQNPVLSAATNPVPNAPAPARVPRAQLGDPFAPVTPTAEIQIQPPRFVSQVASEYQRGAEAGGPSAGIALGAREALGGLVSGLVTGAKTALQPTKPPSPGPEPGVQDAIAFVRQLFTGEPTRTTRPAAAGPLPPIPGVISGSSTAQPVQAQPAPEEGTQVAAVPRQDFGAIVAGAMPPRRPSILSAIAQGLSNAKTLFGTRAALSTGVALDRIQRASDVRPAKDLARAAGTYSTLTGADAAAQRSAIETEGMQLKNSQVRRLVDLQEKLRVEQDPVKRRKLEAELLVLQGKDPRDNKLQTVTIEEPIDPANPALGTRKIPVILDAQGNARPVTVAALGGGAPQPQYEEGKVYRDAAGTVRRYENGAFIEVK